MGSRCHRLSVTLPSLLLGALCITSGSPRSEPRCQRFSKEVGDLMNAGDNLAVVTKVSEALECCRGMSRKQSLQLLQEKAEALTALDRYSEALDILKAEIPGNPEYSDLRSVRALDQGWIYYSQRKYDEADRAFDTAEREAKNNPQRLTDIAFRRVYVYQDQNKPEDVRRTLDRIRQGVSADNPYFLTTYGWALQQDARFEEAAQYFERANPKLAEIKNPAEIASSYLNLGAIYYKLGDLHRASAFLSKAEPGLRKAGDRDGLRICLTTRGVIETDRDETEKAEADLRSALALTANAQAEAEVLTDLAGLFIKEKRWEEAQEFNRRGLEIKHRWHNPEAEIFSLVNEARIHEGRNDFSSALEALDSALTERVNHREARIDAEAEYISIFRKLKAESEARSHFYTGLALSDIVRSEMRDTENKLAWNSTEASLYREWVRFLVDMNHPEEALEAVESSRTKLMLERWEAKGLPFGKTRVEAYQAVAKARHAALVSYWLMPETSYAWVITANNVTLCRLPSEQTIASLVSDYQGVIEDQGDPIRAGSSTGARLREAVLDPVLPSLGKADEVIVVPDGPLHALNFETLPVNGHYWIQSVTLTVTPSLNLLSARKPTARPTEASLLAIGDAKSTPEYPHLPGASEEMRTIAQLFPGSMVISGSDATPRAYLEATRSHPYIHFAAHASANAERPLDSAVILSPAAKDDGRLTARSLIDQPVSAELVTISACSSAGVRSYHGEGLVGFAWAFLQSGAHGVIAGLWNANDEASARMMTSLYQQISHGSPPAKALRTAKLALLQSDSHFSRPYYWAPFQYYLGADR